MSREVPFMECVSSVLFSHLSVCTPEYSSLMIIFAVLAYFLFLLAHTAGPADHVVHRSVCANKKYGNAAKMTIKNNEIPVLHKHTTNSINYTFLSGTRRPRCIFISQVRCHAVEPLLHDSVGLLPARSSIEGLQVLCAHEPRLHRTQ